MGASLPRGNPTPRGVVVPILVWNVPPASLVLTAWRKPVRRLLSSLLVVAAAGAAWSALEAHGVQGGPPPGPARAGGAGQASQPTGTGIIFGQVVDVRPAGSRSRAPLSPSTSGRGLAARASVRAAPAPGPWQLNRPGRLRRRFSRRSTRTNASSRVQANGRRSRPADHRRRGTLRLSRLTEGNSSLSRPPPPGFSNGSIGQTHGQTADPHGRRRPGGQRAPRRREGEALEVRRARGHGA